MELGWEEKHLQAVCYRAEDETAAIAMKQKPDLETIFPFWYEEYFAIFHLFSISFYKHVSEEMGEVFWEGTIKMTNVIT